MTWTHARAARVAFLLSFAAAAPALPQGTDTLAPDRIPDVPIRPGPEPPGPPVETDNPYQGDKRAIRQGQRLFEWYNCAGCHAPKGGGGMGPPLSDDDWIYGSDDASIFRSIWEGRPEGMPTFAGQIPEDEVWKIVAYIKTLPGDRPNWAPQDR